MTHVSEEPQKMACGRCRLSLNVYFRPDGEMTYVHCREWEDHGHEPEPVPAASVEVLHACDFCGVSGAQVSYDTIETAMLVPEANFIQQHQKTWYVCYDCEGPAREQRYGLLLERYQTSQSHRAADRHMYGGRTASREARELQKRMALAMWRAVVPQFTNRTVLIPPQVAPVDVRMLPKVRDRLVKFWASDLARRAMQPSEETIGPVMMPGVDAGMEDKFSVPRFHPDFETLDAFCRRQEVGLSAAELYWISEDFTTLAVRAGKKLPDVSVARDELPSDHGLVVFAKPILELPFGGAVPGQVVAASWTLVPNGVWVILYCQPEQAMPFFPLTQVRQFSGWLAPFGPGCGAPFGPLPPLDDIGERARTLWTTLLATWFLMRQPGVATEREAAPHKDYAKAYARRHGRRPSPVRVVDLRKQPRRPKGAANESTGRVITVRSLVGAETGGFWRDQAHGPNWSLRKRLWIDPFIRGPEGAPFKGDPPPVVHRLK